MGVRDQMQADQQVRESRGESLVMESGGGEPTPPQPSDPAGPVEEPIGTPDAPSAPEQE